MPRASGNGCLHRVPAAHARRRLAYGMAGWPSLRQKSELRQRRHTCASLSRGFKAYIKSVCRLVWSSGCTSIAAWRPAQLFLEDQPALVAEPCTACTAHAPQAPNHTHCQCLLTGFQHDLLLPGSCILVTWQARSVQSASCWTSSTSCSTTSAQRDAAAHAREPCCHMQRELQCRNRNNYNGSDLC